MPANSTDLILAALLETLPEGWRVNQIYLGTTWTASFIESEAGERRIGLAAAHSAKPVTEGDFLQYGFNRLDRLEAPVFSRYALSQEPLEAAAGLATLNALLKPDPASLGQIDAGDWLVEQSRDRRVALVGRFPFIDEIEPVARQLWVFELEPRPGEFSFSQAPEIIPQAEVLAITGSTLLNHSLQNYLALANPTAKVIVLGPSTPLSPVMFNFGIDLLSGIEVADEKALLDSLAGGLSFRKMRGTKRVSLARPTS
jgi:uncharacterized protein (DUF4213/DUF364 family)